MRTPAKNVESGRRIWRTTDEDVTGKKIYQDYNYEGRFKPPCRFSSFFSFVSSRPFCISCSSCHSGPDVLSWITSAISSSISSLRSLPIPQSLQMKEKEKEGLLPVRGLNILKADRRDGASLPRSRGRGSSQARRGTCY